MKINRNNLNIFNNFITEKEPVKYNQIKKDNILSLDSNLDLKTEISSIYLEQINLFKDVDSMSKIKNNDSNLVERAKDNDIYKDALNSKYEKMNESSFSFFRATNGLFNDLINENKDLLVLLKSNINNITIQGDAHLENIGTYKNNNNDIVYGFNDFDDSKVGSYKEDLARMSTSILMANGSSEDVKIFVDKYIEAVNNNVNPIKNTSELSKKSDFMKSKIGKKKDKGERSTLKEKEGKIVSLSNREKLISDLKNDSNFIISLASKFGVDKSDIKIEDIKFKIGGTASLGKTRYNILIELKNEETGNFDDKWKNHRLIDLKESQDPEKSIKNAKKMLNNSDESRYITNIELDNGKFYIREDSPKNKGEFIQEDILYKDGQINLADLSGLDKTNYLEMIANSVAYSHLQTGNKDEIVNDAGDEISVEMVKASEILFKSFNEMHQEFQDAYENNEFKI